MKKFLISKRYLAMVVIVVIVTMGGGALFFLQKDSVPATSFSKKEKVWETTFVKIAEDFSSIKVTGKVQSNRFAVISPRRSGIIQDLLVDIGDEVYKGQTIGSMLPEGVEGQSSAAIAESSARLQKARAELGNLRGVATDAVSVATKQWRESNLKSETQSFLKEETQRQLNEKKLEAVLVATQAWENTKLVLFGSGANRGSRSIQGSFSDFAQENKVKSLADEIQRMEESDQWNNLGQVMKHLSHLENFLVQTELLYKNAQEGNGSTAAKISSNLSTVQNQQLKISQIKQAILSLEEKSKRFSSVQAERVAGAERSREVLDLVQSQQSLATTQAERNIQVALANYNTALIKAGHQTITSPFSGKITARMVDVGQWGSKSQPFFYLEGAETNRSSEAEYEIHFSLPESWRNKISVGDMVKLKIAETNESLDGRVFRLSEQINLKTNSIMATAIIDNLSKIDLIKDEETSSGKGEDLKTPKIVPKSEKLQHGQSVFVYLTEPESKFFTVPTLSIKKRRTDYFIWKMEDETPVQLKIEILAEDGEFSQIFSQEILVNDKIITNPSVSLFKKSKQ